MVKTTRRSTLTAIAAIVISGCLSSPVQSNQTIIANVSSVGATTIDGTKSALGYVKFIEDAENNAVTIEQSIKIPGNPCESVQMNVSPQSGATNNDPITIDVSLSNSGLDVACPNVRPENYPEPSTITINFESLSVGQQITVSFGEDVSVSYTTTGENNTTTREPFNIPDGVRVG